MWLSIRYTSRRYNNNMQHLAWPDASVIARSKLKSDNTIFPHKVSYSWGRRPTLLKLCWNHVLEWGFSRKFFSVWPKFDLWHECCFNVGPLLGHRPYIKQHISAGLVAHRKWRTQNPPHPTRHVREGWINVEPTSQTAGAHKIDILLKN